MATRYFRGDHIYRWRVTDEGIDVQYVEDAPWRPSSDCCVEHLIEQEAGVIEVFPESVSI